MKTITIPVKYIDTTKYIAKVTVDEYCDSPTEWGKFSIVTFCRNRLITDVEPSEYYADNGKLKAEYKKMLESGKMFAIDLYEHGNSSYTLANEGMNCAFDTSSHTGFIIFEDEYIAGASFEERKHYARQDLREYSDWCNGEVYEVDITTESGRKIDSMSGIIGVEYVYDCIRDTINDAKYKIEWL